MILATYFLVCILSVGNSVTYFSHVIVKLKIILVVVLYKKTIDMVIFFLMWVVLSSIWQVVSQTHNT